MGVFGACCFLNFKKAMPSYFKENLWIYKVIENIILIKVGLFCLKPVCWWSRDPEFYPFRPSRWQFQIASASPSLARAKPMISESSWGAWGGEGRGRVYLSGQSRQGVLTSDICSVIPVEADAIGIKVRFLFAAQKDHIATCSFKRPCWYRVLFS